MSVDGKSNILVSEEVVATSEDSPSMGCEFSLTIKEDSENKWTYSQSENKLCTMLDTLIPMQFEWLNEGKPRLLNIKAYPVFATSQGLQTPVTNVGAASIAGFESMPDFIKSDDRRVFYHFDSRSNFPSVYLPVDNQEPGPVSVTVNYAFENHPVLTQKQFTLLFTLEHLSGKVLGRLELAVIIKDNETSIQAEKKTKLQELRKRKVRFLKLVIADQVERESEDDQDRESLVSSSTETEMESVDSCSTLIINLSNSVHQRKVLERIHGALLGLIRREDEDGRLRNVLELVQKRDEVEAKLNGLLYPNSSYYY